MGVNAYDELFGNKARRGPNLFQKFINYGVGAAKVGMGVAEGLAGNPLGFLGAAESFGGMVKDRMDGRL